MKLLVINNLKSGYGEGAVYDFIRSFVGDGDEVCMRATDGSTEVATMLDDATSFDAVIASGGDGTVAAVSYVLAGTGIPVLPFPAGTANLLALNLHSPNEPHALAKMVKSGLTLDDVDDYKAKIGSREPATTPPSCATRNRISACGAPWRISPLRLQT